MTALAFRFPVLIFLVQHVFCNTFPEAVSAEVSKWSEVRRKMAATSPRGKSRAVGQRG